MKKEKLTLERIYTKGHEKDPFFGINFIKHNIEVKGGNGKVVFSDNEVIAPDFWSEHAVTILAKNYFRKSTDGTGDHSTGEHDLRVVIKRLCLAWCSKEYTAHLLDDEGRQILEDEMSYMLVHQIGAPNSPQWFNTGLYEMYNTPPKNNSDVRYFVDERTEQVIATTDEIRRAQAHACFIVGMEDNLVGEDGIYDTIKTSAKLFKLGSGSGINITALRSSSASLSGGGVSSGPLSFAKIFDASAASIKSGGTTRRAAQMLTADIDHADIDRFINWKAEEEHKLSALVLGSRLLNSFWQDYVKLIFAIVDMNVIDKINTLELYKEIVRQSDSILHYLSGNKQENDLTTAPFLALIGKYANFGIDDKNITNVIFLVHNLLLTGKESNLDGLSFITNLKNHVELGCSKVFNYDFNEEGVATLSGQSINLSLRVHNKFLETAISNPNSDEAKRLHKIAMRAWESGDPALQYTDTIDAWHTCSNSGRINASNPCSEFMFLDNTACNLASVNLAKFIKNGEFDFETYGKVVEFWTLVLDISITMAQFPTAKIALNSYQFRPLGLGFCNLGYALALLKLPYSKNENTLKMVRNITATMTGKAFYQSSKIAKVLGSFKHYEHNRVPFTKVLEKHMEYLQDDSGNWSSYLKKLWLDVLNNNNAYGMRNAQVTCIAPTGTIGFVMGASTTGIEPEFSYKTWKKVMDGSWMELPSQTFEQYLNNFLDVVDKEKVLEMMNYQNNSFVKAIYAIGRDYFDNKYGANFANVLFDNIKVANSPDLETTITVEDHVAIMSACQYFISGAISKTINLPATATIQDVLDSYILSHKSGLKGITVYRDGCKGSQPLNFSKENSVQDIITEIKENYKEHEQTEEAVMNEWGQKLVSVKCKSCGSETMKPNGTCSVCLNCGATTGCS